MALVPRRKRQWEEKLRVRVTLEQDRALPSEAPSQGDGLGACLWFPVTEAPLTCWFAFNYSGEPQETTAGTAIFWIDSAAAAVWEPAYATPDLTQWKKPKADGLVRGEAKCVHQIHSY